MTPLAAPSLPDRQGVTVGSLFSGIGGLDLGLERAGMTVKWQVEIDEYCRQVLAKHWPGVTRYGDIKTLTGRELEPVDLICGGFPCQPVSVAGQRKGDGDVRWLWPDYLRIIRAVRPQWVVAENVPGLLSIGHGRLFAGVLRDLAESGYDAEWDCLSAAAVGAPHLRYRVFIVAHARTGRRPDNGLRTGWSIFGGRGSQMADSNSSGWRGRTQGQGVGRAETERDEAGGQSGNCGLSYADGERLQEQRWPVRTEQGLAEWSNRWEPEPNVGRVAHGVPARVDRLKGLGNAVVPQVAEFVGRRILASLAR